MNNFMIQKFVGKMIDNIEINSLNKIFWSKTGKYLMCVTYVFEDIYLPSNTFIECVNAFNKSEFSLTNSIELIKEEGDWYVYFK